MKDFFWKLYFTHRGKYLCPLCDCRLVRFKMLGHEYLKEFEKSLFPHSIFAFETLNVLQYSCPCCGASDRARLYKAYIDRYLAEPKGQPINMLDIAPDPLLSAHLKKDARIKYRSANISGDDVDDTVDITDMAIYESERFDFIICSHVLEHVNDDRKAMRELFRVLKPGGQAIVMVPVLLTIKGIDEDEKVTSAAARMARFGQDDHIRLYSKDGFVERLATAGFKVNQYSSDFFGADVFQRYGILERSVLYVAQKQLPR